MVRGRMAARAPPTRARSSMRSSPAKRASPRTKRKSPRTKRTSPTKKRTSPHRTLCARGKSAAKRKFDVWPSLHASAYASRVCLGEVPDLSGQYRADPRYLAETEAIRKSGRLTGLQKAYKKRKYQFLKQAPQRKAQHAP